ncbi:PilN domain-containing protein [Chungangia koreensis]|uniref:PilN domain-containing protein n=1 Tax=Chungangia koreensis TaxID=752657 RepID=A0ABV8X5K8_9LACT
MYVDINLLQKKKTYVEWLFIAGILFVISLSIAVFLFSQFSERKSEENQIESSIEQELQLQQATIESAEVTKSAEEQMAAIVDWAKHQPVPTVFLLDHLSSMMPERGFLLSFSYSSSSTATFSMQFDDNVDAAYYLKMLKDSSYITDVKLSSIGTMSTSDETAPDEESYFQPRSVADFEIIINVDEVKAATLKWEDAS